MDLGADVACKTGCLFFRRDEVSNVGAAYSKSKSSLVPFVGGPGSALPLLPLKSRIR